MDTFFPQGFRPFYFYKNCPIFAKFICRFTGRASTVVVGFISPGIQKQPSPFAASRPQTAFRSCQPPPPLRDASSSQQQSPTVVHPHPCRHHFRRLEQDKERFPGRRKGGHNPCRRVSVMKCHRLPAVRRRAWRSGWSGGEGRGGGSPLSSAAGSSPTR